MQRKPIGSPIRQAKPRSTEYTLEFRHVTDGAPQDDIGDKIAALTELSDLQICGLWDFIQHGAKFDMDASLFEAFTTEYLNRNQTSN